MPGLSPGLIKWNWPHPFPKSEVASSSSVTMDIGKTVSLQREAEDIKMFLHVFNGLEEASCPDHSPFLVFYHSKRSEGFRIR